MRKRPITSTGLLVTFNKQIPPTAQVIFATLLLLASFTFAQVNTTRLFLTGDAAPGFPGLTLQFASLELNNTGRFLLNARLAGPGVTDDNTWASYVGDSPSSLALVARDGDQAPGFAPGLAFAWLNTHLSDSGIVTFFAPLRNQDAYLGVGTLWSGTPGHFQLLVRNGDPIPDSQPPQTQRINSLATNSAGAVLLQGVVEELPYELGQYLALIAPGSFQLIAHSGNVAPGIDAHYTDLGGVLNDSGQVAFSADTDIPGNGIWLATPQSAELIAYSGRPAPGTGRNFGDLRLDALNNRGEIAFREASGDGIWLYSQSGFKHIAATGEPSPVPAHTYDFVSDVRLGQNGNLNFRSTLSGPGITDSNDTAFFAGPPDDLKLIAREGDLAPGTGLRFVELKNMFASSSGEWMDFCASLDPTRQTSGGVCDSLWISDPTGNLHLITYVGQTIDINGVSWPVQFLANYGGINDNGVIAYTVALNQNTFATFVATVPEPASAALLIAIGCVMSLIRRR